MIWDTERQMIYSQPQRMSLKLKLQLQLQLQLTMGVREGRNAKGSAYASFWNFLKEILEFVE